MKNALKFAWKNLPVITSVILLTCLAISAYNVTGEVLPQRTYTAWQSFFAFCFYVLLWDAGRQVGRMRK